MPIPLRLPRLALLVLAASSSAAWASEPDAGSAAPPPGLACLAKWYPGVRPVQEEGGRWGFQLAAGGPTYAFDDGRVKSFDERLESPDLEDALSLPYRAGPVVPVTGVNEDPGRIRFDPLFHATYGASAEQVRAALVPVVFAGTTLKVHAKVAPAFRRVAERVEALLAADASLRPFVSKVGGTFNWRTIANTKRQSAHSYGVSLDLNVARSHYWEWQKPKEPVRWANAIPQVLVDAFEAEGFIWGGRWYHYDTMHFEYRPELLDPACRAP
ncbi:M15 family metallopeptidase [Citreicoccus inhibens]|uniref:M15 family metallopeptidase n=1 Tax=Citreicoccus inhibens TaxID=2849499 RepID=UPI002AA529AA|nr:M15 family metallopeptidase [Citreicoccus inhibens]